MTHTIDFGLQAYLRKALGMTDPKTVEVIYLTNHWVVFFDRQITTSQFERRVDEWIRESGVVAHEYRVGYSRVSFTNEADARLFYLAFA